MTFEQFFRILIKRWSLVVICFLFVGLGAYLGISKLIKPLYQSTAVVEVAVSSGGTPLSNDNILASQQLAGMEAQLAITYPILSQVALHYRGLSADDLTKEVTVATVADTPLFQVNVLDPSPKQAASLANNVVATLIKQQQQLVTQQTTVPAVLGTITVTPQPPIPQQNFLVVVQSARPASSPVLPNKLVYTVAGLLVGLFLGIALAMLLELLDARIGTKEALTQLLGWPVLGTLWQATPEEDTVNPIGHNSNVESYNILRANVGLTVIEKPLQTLVVTSGNPDEGKSVVAANLAIFMARAGKNTLLIDANLRRPTLHEQFGIPAHAMGFSNAVLMFSMQTTTNTLSTHKTDIGASSASVVTNEVSLGSFVRAVDIPNLYVMPSGPLPPNPLELLDSKAIQGLLAALNKCGAEVVIFDAPPLLGLSDAGILASKVDGTLVVVDITRASKRNLTQVKAQLEQANAHVLGYVVNKQRRCHEDTSNSYGDRAEKRSNRDTHSRKITSYSATSVVTPTVSKQPGIPSQPKRYEPMISMQSTTPSQPKQDGQNDGGKHGPNNGDLPSVSVGTFDDRDQTIIKPLVGASNNRRKMAERISPSLIFSALALPVALFLGVAISRFNPIYSFVIAGALAVMIILLFRKIELFAVLIVTAQIFIDSYLGFAAYQPSLLMALGLLVICYFGRSADRPWTGPLWLWLWLVFLILNIVPMLKGGDFSLSNSFGYYLEVIFSPFILFWLGNVMAKDISSVRRVFQFLAVLAALVAIHAIIQATTGKFLFETARAQADLAKNFKIEGRVPRAGSFFINPNGSGVFMATCFFLPLGLFVESKHFWAKVIHLVEMLLILMALMFSYSNGSWLAAIGGIFVFIFLAGRLRYSVLLLLLVVALGFTAFIAFPSQVAVQLSHAKDQGDLSLHLASWQTAARVLQAYPLFGVGLGTQAYLIRSQPYMVAAQTKLLQEPDNSYLQWGAIAGIPVMLIFLVLLFLMFWYAWRNWLIVDTRYRSLLGAGICSLIALSIDSLTVDGWTDGGFLIWLVAGLITSPLIGRYMSRQSVPLVDKTVEETVISYPRQTPPTLF